MWTIYQVINLQKSRHLFPHTTLPYCRSFHLLRDLTNRSCHEIFLIPIVNETQLLTMVKTYAKMYAKFRKCMYASEKTAIRSFKNFADFQPFQPCVSLSRNFLNYFSCVVELRSGSWFPWCTYFFKWLGWGKLHNDIDISLFAVLLELLVINHCSSERKNIFVPRWLRLVRLQFAWVRIWVG